MNEEDEMSQGYERELVAEMLDEYEAGRSQERRHSKEAIHEQARLLRAADNRDAFGMGTASANRAELTEPLRVFSAGMWKYDGTGESFSHEDLDAAAFVEYRNALRKPTPPAPDAVRALVESGEKEIRMWDSQWVNVVNAPEVLNAESTEDAVNVAVRMTEAAMAKNYADGKWPVRRLPASEAALSAQEPK